MNPKYDKTSLALFMIIVLGIIAFTFTVGYHALEMRRANHAEEQKILNAKRLFHQVSPILEANKIRLVTTNNTSSTIEDLVNEGHLDPPPAGTSEGEETKYSLRKDGSVAYEGVDEELCLGTEEVSGHSNIDAECNQSPDGLFTLVFTGDGSDYLK